MLRRTNDAVGQILRRKGKKGSESRPAEVVITPFEAEMLVALMEVAKGSGSQDRAHPSCQ